MLVGSSKDGKAVVPCSGCTPPLTPPLETLGWRSHEHERCLVHVNGILAQHFRAQLILNDNKCIKVALDKDSRSVCRLRAQTQPVH